MNVQTPIRRQYLDIKRHYEDAILLFRMGDFYETFDEDAQITAALLEIVLTSREMGKGNRIPLAGIPYHALDNYLARLVKAGHKVAICEQIGDTNTKGLVERAVTRVVTPGTVIEPYLLDQSVNNYLASVSLSDDEAGFSYVDISTGAFYSTQLNIEDLYLEVYRVRPSELIITEGDELPFSIPEIVITHLDRSTNRLYDPKDALIKHFDVFSLEPYGIEDKPLAISASSLIIYYVGQTQHESLAHLTDLISYTPDSYMTLDPQTRNNLELFTSERSKSKEHSLLGIMDETNTPMGGRLIRSWISQPLLDVLEIKARQDVVQVFHDDQILREQVRKTLEAVPDIERILNRTISGLATPREILSLKMGFIAVGKLKTILIDSRIEETYMRSQGLEECVDLVALIERAIDDSNIHGVEAGHLIKPGFSHELDKVRELWIQSREYISGIESRERENTEIKSLKVGYNRVFGYYIEVSNSNLDNVPKDYIRRQTLSNAERFITMELKEYEDILLNAQETMNQMENAIYRQVCIDVAKYFMSIASTAEAVASIDVLCSLAEVASRYRYTRPILDEDSDISIESGRHPVLEAMSRAGSFVPNDTHLSNEDGQLIILTGPNMSGKSTYIRQVALIVLMAQVGSFVPATSARIGLVDRIFTRVGLQDDLSTGQSTFMVEMIETSAILRHATHKSLIILDEIGRGTSTYDGLAIARAVAEYIHNNPRLGCKTLFATHYHELVKLSELLPRIRNYCVAVSEQDGEVVFLHRIIPGGADKSYGVHVARLAGLPPGVISRAWDLLNELETDGLPSNFKQEPLFSIPDPVLEELLQLDISNITPINAINVLNKLQEMARGNE